MGWAVRHPDPGGAGHSVIFRETLVPGVFVVEPEPREDHRGFFARIWCAREFAEHGLDARLVQCSMSYNRRRGTLRGMHVQAASHAEAKLIRCTRGAIYDVALDIRPESATFGQHVAAELSAANHIMLYIPAGVAHGFQTLEDDTEVVYQMSEFHAPEAARGFRYDDPAFAIRWPVADPIILERDATYPDFTVPPARPEP
jgi:dTDP-4-dehydrorhamnose 3,5-epimerase